MNENSLTTVATFTFPLEAQIARATLESGGIPAFVADEHTINMQWLFSNAMGGVRVQVPGKYLHETRKLLSIDFSNELNSEIGQRSCVHCGSSKLAPYTQGRKPAYILFLLLGFPLFFYKHGYKCEECGTFNNTYPIA